MKFNRGLIKLLLMVFSSGASGQCLAVTAEPIMDSWLKMESGKYAQIYASDRDRMTGHTLTTWVNNHMSQPKPAFDGVQAIYSSENWVYILSTGLGSQVMGPWYIDSAHRIPFPNLPTDQHMILRLPRHPKAQSPRSFNPLGEIGMTVDGVRLFDANDAFSYSNREGRDANPRSGFGHGDQVWNRDAYLNESVTFDAAFGHQQNWGRYHYHAEPVALRYLLGDHVDFDAANKTYRESSAAPVKHSPLLGWMHDGYPLYGPYGFSNPTNSASGVRRMISGFVPRNGENGADDLRQTGRRSWPKWAAREFDQTVSLEQNEFGPAVSDKYPIGHYIEDYAFLGDCARTGAAPYDLDECNGRWCVTPEFPRGTYAYFTTIDASAKPVYPYNMGRRYHGEPSGRLIKSIPETVTANFVAHPKLASNAIVAPKTTTLLWTPSGYAPGEK